MSPEPEINPCPPTTKSTKQQPKTTRHHHIDSKFKQAATTSQEPRTTNNLFTDNLCANTAPKDTTDNPSFTKKNPETTATLTDNMQTNSKKEISLAPSKLPPACTTPGQQHAVKHHQPQPPRNAPAARPQATWADRVRVTDASTRFKLQNLDKQPSGSRLVIAQESLPETTEQWTRSMVGFFPGYKMPFHAAKSIARRAWEGYGLEQFELQTPLSTMPTTVRIEYEWKPTRCTICYTYGHSCKKNSDNQNPQHKPEAKQNLEQDPLNMDKHPTTQNDPPNQEHHPPKSTAETTHPQPVTATSQQYPPSKKQNANEKTQDKSQDLDRPHLPPKHQESQLNTQTKPPKPNSTENQKMDQQQSNQPTSHTQETAQKKGQRPSNGRHKQ
ncbi:hypothetical protein OIU79_001545 [Salix purpurea]|uniref:Uncharacterized protein n=1 Tax=Salix purpurea TaxID=77065 RepID=A0A9Q0UQP6_SALPP|nr:hypothetical protein OIU79_001545 [Salix purpurea]